MNPLTGCCKQIKTTTNGNCCLVKHLSKALFFFLPQPTCSKVHTPCIAKEFEQKAVIASEIFLIVGDKEHWKGTVIIYAKIQSLDLCDT
ncbi:hypothetical protein GYH30_029364 [Glycine max]|uniref:Uncharacterized protein n=1 Tax=Glycine max TaxID=3847 RepID=K7LLV4_SOYBN|nr:hypothetical protein GYH30_029364 [Glycine max]